MLVIQLFGAPRFQRGGQPILISRRKVVALAAYLAVTGRPASRDTLAALLWPEHDQSSALKNLRRELARLKKSVGDDTVIADRIHLALSSEVVSGSDVARFREHMAFVHNHSHRHDQPCDRCLQALHSAVELYSDEFMAGFHLPDCAEFEQWQLYERSSLTHQMIDALQQLSGYYETQGEYQRALPFARRQLSLDTLQEAAHRALMRLHALAGQQVAALRQYEVCVELLEDELGVEPDSETQALYEAIRERRFSADRDQTLSARPVPVVPKPRHNLPVQGTSFVGRKRELTIVLLRLQEADCRLLTLVGPGGIGKTRLALEAARTFLETKGDTFADGAFFVSLAQVSSVDGVAPAIVEALGHSPEGNLPASEQVLRLLTGARLLLVLDNMEHLLPGSTLLADILAAAPGIKILVTSRESLNLQEEWVQSIGAMSLPPLEGSEESAMASKAYDSVQLFAQAARRVQVDFSLEAELADIVRICHLVQGMPLALVLAAGWRELMTSRQLADELEKSLDILESDARNLPPRQRSVRAAFESSWIRLSSEDQQAFAKLCVFRGGFTRSGAQAVAGAGLRTLRTLVKKSFLTLSPHGRYDIHELLRQLGAEKLEAQGRANAARAAHSAYFMELMRLSEEDLKGRNQLSALQKIALELENVSSAWERAVQQRDETVIDHVLQSIYLFFDVRGRHRDGAHFLQTARLALAPQHGEQPGRVWGRVLALHGLFEFHYRGAQEEIGSQLDQALQIARLYGDPTEIGFALMVSGEYAGLAQRDLARAAALMEESLTYFRALNDTFYITYVTLWLGYSYAQVEGLRSYDRFTQEALQLARVSGNKVGASNALAHLVDAAFSVGDYRTAEQHAAEALDIGMEMDLRGCIAHARAQLSLAFLLRGEAEQAHALAEAGLRVAREIRYSASIAYALNVLSLHAALTGEYEAGAQLGEQSRPLPAGDFTRMLGHWARATNACGLGQDDEALREVQAIIRYAHQHAYPGMMTWALPVLGLAAAYGGRSQQAVQLLATGLNHPLSPSPGLEQWSLVEEVLLTLRQELGEDCYEEAWKAGASSSLNAIIAQSWASIGSEWR